MDGQGFKNHFIGTPEGEKAGNGRKAISEKVVAKNFYN